MDIFVPDILTIAVAALALASFVYLTLAIERVLRFRSRLRRPPASGHMPPVTVMKPLCGEELGLAENLRSFCRQDYATFQIVCGVRDKADPSVTVVDRIKAEFPDVDIVLATDARTLGVNLKIANLAHMLDAARHDILVISDSDMRVGPDYLKSVAAPFESDKVGAATCLYAASARLRGGGVATQLGAMFINDWFLPSALIPMLFGKLSYCFGATMAVRRDVLARSGGFPALAGHIADDYLLGRRVVEQGLDIAFVPYVVENITNEPNLKALFAHELRWARTIRCVQPVGYAFSFITESVPLALIAAITVYMTTLSMAPALALVGGALLLRIALHLAVYVTVGRKGCLAPWLIPLRDLFSVVVRVASFFGNKVVWRGQEMTVGPVKGKAIVGTQQRAFGD